MTVPVSAVYVGTLIDLSGHTLASPDGDDAPLAGYLRVHESYTGRPTGRDLAKVYDMRLATAPVGKGEAVLGHTLVVTPIEDTRAIMIHFSADQYEVAVVQDDQDDEWRTGAAVCGPVADSPFPARHL